MAADLGAIAQRLFEGVMAPLVLGGPIVPGHAIGARAALALGEGERTTIDPDLEARVQQARVRRARRLAPVDRLPPATRADWALAAALHDMAQSASPSFDGVLRRSYAVRILALVRETLDRVPPPSTVHEALARHTWLARVLDVARTDTVVSWWTGSRTFLGIDPSRRLQAWPELRRVNVAATHHALVDVAPIAVDRGTLVDTMAQLLARTPLTEIATCTRASPPFSWGAASLALVTTRPGRTLAIRALARLTAVDVDAVLGRATRELLSARREAAAPAVTLLAERALAQAQSHEDRPPGGSAGAPAEVAFARGLGAAAATFLLEDPGATWPEAERRRLLAALEPVARSPAAVEATAMLGKAS
jgi:hypothetical protein